MIWALTLLKLNMKWAIWQQRKNNALQMHMLFQEEGKRSKELVQKRDSIAKKKANCLTNYV